MSRAVTIRDVAHAAGVSLGTASRALNRSGPVSEAAIAAVTKAARKLGYEADAIAQSMRTRSTGIIGLLVSDIANPFYARIINSLEATLQAAGYTLILANTRGSRHREKALADMLRRRRVDGLIVAPCEAEAPEVLEQLRRQIPVVSLDRDFGPEGSGVHVDHYQGALQATRHLLNLGHTRIAILTPGAQLRAGRERLAGYADAFRERGYQPVPKLVRSERTAMDYAFSEALGLLSMDDPPTAFLCLGTRILAGVLQALRHSGRSVPEDVSVISIGDTDLSQLFSPAITALNWDLDAVGSALGQLMVRQLDHDSTWEPERIVITTQMILRESCATSHGPTPGAAAISGIGSAADAIQSK